ncbi:MAG: ATP-binding protein [Saprospiraceae bacterium]|nr:ATP-binding protein [Saprospiraceae bacterium]
MNIDWIKLRPFNGDIKNGFEELVCQLARAESIKDKQQFIRVAAPDGGVEAYCILKNGDEYGWQAKFFSSMEDSQWTQIDKSFKTAFAKHPNLKKYFICTPLDRQDPRIVTKKGTVVKHFMDVWKEKVAYWEAFATASGRKIEFEYWGNSELFDRLNKPENEGKLYYWFGQEEFSDNWFKQKLEESILNLGKRYTPEINFDLPIAKVFEGLSRDKYFKKQFLSHLDDLLKKYNQAVSHVKADDVKDSVQKIDSIVNQFRQLCQQIDFEEITIIQHEDLSAVLESCKEIIETLIHKFYELDSKKKEETKSKKEYVSEVNSYGWDIEYFRKLSSSIYGFTKFLYGSIVGLSSNPFLILTGEAGIGKSHLLADVAKKREARNQFTILLLGQQFSTKEDPWSQIIKLLQIECKRDTFLSALNSKAESTGARVLIFIDAINEGEGKAIWMNHMASFITAVKRFPNLGVVFSLRTSYEKLLIPDVVKEKKQATRITHYGFANHEYEASKLFFDNYKIKQPSIPLLHPEFSNPLFLKLFCEGLHKKGLHEIPDGYEGISTIINFFLETINDKVSDKHNQPRKLQIVQKVVRQIAERVVDTNNSYIKFDDAFSFVIDMKETKAVTDKSQFFQDLISEGLLTQNVYWDREGNHFEGIYISYERFSDHLIASHLLAKFLNKKNPKKSFSEDTKFAKTIKVIAAKIGVTVEPKKLFEILKTEKEANYNRGIIEALSIQLPEQTNLELYEAAEHAREFQPVAAAFIESIIWRKKETLSDKLKDYINQVVIGNFDYHDYFINTILLVTSHPQNYFNSDFLHNHLWRFSMADRDAWWTQLIHKMYPGYSDEVSAIRRMIDWAWAEDKRESISDESIRLMSQTMIWFLTSCNRTLRDSATKAIICLLQERINVLIQLIKTFEKVNDPYVLQRIYTIAYGCAVRTSNTELLKPLGDLTFQAVFNTENVIPDILLRDYAKGIIEFAVFKGHKFDFDVAKIQPPFKSNLPATFPTNDETDKFKFNYEDKDFKKHQWSQNSILSSMVTEYGRGTSGYGDFGRYTFQSGLSDWRVDVNGLSNLAVKWIIEKYGYDVEKHGEFDRTIGSDRSRDNGREERIGKKYQWIAFYEILARVSDNYLCYENSYSRDAKEIKYEGPWEPYVRDIDPTTTIKGNLKDKSKTYWWNPVVFSNWNLPNKDWVSLTNDLPSPQNLVSVTDEHGIEWLVLEMYPAWNEPTPLGEEEYKSPHKRLVYDLSSHIVYKKDLQKIIDYLTNRNLRGCGLSESKTRYQMFSREYYWAAANRTFNTYYYGGNEWDELHNEESGEYICNTARTAIQYFWEEEFDASKDETISFYKPTELVFRLLDLQYSKGEGQLLNTKGEMICFDPSATTPSIRCLLVRKPDLLKVLAENDLEIIWTSVGEKLVIGGHFNRTDWVGRLNISDVVYFESGTLKHTSHYEME